MKASYRFRVEIPMRWGDQDAMGHLNNAKFFTFFEEARIRFFENMGKTVPGGALSGQAPILAKTDCTFAEQLVWPGTVSVGISVGRIGNKSFTLEQAIFLPDSETLAAHGHAVIVWFDYEANKSVALPDIMRGKLEEWL